LLFEMVPLGHAGVGLEYLGPNPLRPQPVSGQVNTLGAGAIVGNTGNEIASITFTLLADASFTRQFTYSISNNNFTLTPSTRENFAIFFSFNPSTIPVQDYTASIRVVASPASKSGTSGSASFDLAVVISAGVLSNSYIGAQITLTTSTGVLSMSSSSATTPVLELSTTSSPQTSSLSTNSSSIDPNLLLGAAIGAVAILLGFAVSNRKKRRGTESGLSDKPAKPKRTTRDCDVCGTPIRLSDKFCDSCGSKQDG
jgi:hypothetical protein